MNVKRLLFVLFLLCAMGYASAQMVQDSVKILFRQGRAELDMNEGDNRKVLEDIKGKLLLESDDSIYYRLEKVLVVGGASPEGSISLNKRLSEQRAATLFNYLSQYGTFPDSVKHTLFIGRDWKGLIRLVEADEELPYREEALSLLESFVDNPREADVWKLRSFKGGRPYAYMYRHLFPALRASSMYLWYSEVKLPPFSAHTSLRKNFCMTQPWLVAPELVVIPPEEEPFYWALKTNLLYDAALVPNVGAEFHLGRNWSAGANWMYAWWKNDASSWYWRIYGGDIYLRKWFGKKAQEKPLTGHHIGIYAQTLTYDFCTGGRGYMGGEPGGNIWDRASFAGGVEYGYSHPISRKLNLDLTIGVGYLGGKYHEYLPIDDCYVWQVTKNRKWFGPTKAEVSLVWLMGKNHENKEKGGRR